MKIYPRIETEGYYSVAPEGFIMSLLDSQILLYFIPIMLIAMIGGFLYLVLFIHNLPKTQWKKQWSENKKSSGIGLINILALLGWFFHDLWVIALIIAFINWRNVQDVIISLVRKISDKNYTVHELSEVEHIDEKTDNKKM
jgi:ABC-type dipeptide/oligopeptide/nickel transport system permease subunit